MKQIERTFRTWDGNELFYRAWLPEQATSRALLLFHRGHEHSGRWGETVKALNLPDVAVFAWDQRGHGHSPGERGCAPDVAAVARDADWFCRHVATEHGIPVDNMVVIAHSVGAVVATTWIHDYAPPIRALVLGAPAFEVKLYIPFAIPLLRLRQRLFGHGYVKSYVKSAVLTHDPEQARAYNEDTLIFRQIAVNVLLDLFDTSRRVAADAGAIVTPTLLLAAGNDWVVKLSAQKRFFAGISSPIKRMEVLPGFYHAIFHEKDRQLLCDKIRAFVIEMFDRTNDRTELLHADEAGYTKRNYDRLQRSGSPLWALVRVGMNTVGRLSRGVSLGLTAGFDSGVMLDYVYENKPRGITPLGRMIDANYLNSPGWSGIRVRRRNLERLLDEVINRCVAEKRPVRILDIAAGAGRYVLATMQRHGNMEIHAHLRDYRQQNLDAAARLAEELGVHTATFERGDAFDRNALAAIRPQPTIAIVSGLYELFPANAPLRESLAGLAAAVKPGGYLIYTNQPWHPQTEFIARVLTNREGHPWIMRCRTQAEMDELVRGGRV
jgi:alpha-beta hydrolase superfamily lysophospholipase